MQRLPTVITTSVIRSAHQGESHGGIYLVDLESGTATQKTDWNNCDIDWEGRGGDRGLRGIAFHGQDIYVAASDEIIIYILHLTFNAPCATATSGTATKYSFTETGFT